MEYYVCCVWFWSDVRSANEMLGVEPTHWRHQETRIVNHAQDAEKCTADWLFKPSADPDDTDPWREPIANRLVTRWTVLDGVEFVDFHPPTIVPWFRAERLVPATPDHDTLRTFQQLQDGNYLRIATARIAASYWIAPH